MPRVRLSAAAALTILLSAVPCLAADDSPAWNVPHFSDDAAGLYKAASAVNPAPGIEVIVLNEEDRFTYDDQGRCAQTRYMVYKILVDNVQKGWDATSLPWEPWHQSRPTLRVRVITPDLVVHPLDAASITDSPQSDDEPDTYGDARVVRAPLPAIEKGSVVEEEDSWTDTKPSFEAGTASRLYFGRLEIPVQSSRLVLDYPAALPLHYHAELLSDKPPVREEQNGRIKLTFDFGSMQPLDQAEDDLPSDVTPYPNIAFSTGASWQTVAETYSKIVDQQIATSDVKPMVAHLIDGKKTASDKLTAIIQYLGREVRYTGVEFGDAAIIPRPPSETLKRKFGDCKDKSTLLVAMLRAAGVPADIALLEVGHRHDIATNLPGMGLFDHAIVYVPGKPDMWIDATDEYARLGELPASDQGRQALIAAPGTTGLVSTYVSSSSQNLLVEKRDIFLAENGPARVVETSLPQGDLESDYRSSYADPQKEETRKNLSEYFQNQYLAEQLDRIDRTDPTDLSKQFSLVLEAKKCKRGQTDIDYAAAAIRLEGLFYRLPANLQEREKKPDNTSSDGGLAPKPKPPRTADYQLAEAFVSEWDYTIVPPAGFRPRSLPKDVSLSLGPAILTESFKSGDDGVLRAVLRFDTVKSRFTVAEATEMRNQIAQVKDGEALLFYFDPIGKTLLSQGKVREAIESYRGLIALHPKESIHHLQIAETLLAAGMGEGARSEAQAAVNLEPTSALAQKTLADILEYDIVGRKLRPGSDYAAAEKAWRAAEKLDPTDKSTIANFAIFLQYNHWGVNYGVGARLNDAITEYQKLTAEEQSSLGIPNNLAFALFYAGRYPEALKAAELLNPKPKLLLIASEAAINGAQAGIGRARSLADGDEQAKSLMRDAGNMLVNMRNYQVAADLLEAGASGDDASGFLADAALYRKTIPFEKLVFSADPAGVAESFELLTDTLDLTADDIRARCSRNGAVVLTADEFVKYVRDDERGTWISKSRRQMIPEVGVDTSFANANPRVQGDDSVGYKVTLWPSTSYKSSMYIVKEDGRYKILADSRQPASIGLEVLDRIAAGDLKGARTLLDWLRDDWKLAGGDDPFVGTAFPRFWEKGSDPDPAAMRLAAAAILTFSDATSAQALSMFRQATPNGDAQKFNIDLSVLIALNRLHQYDQAAAQADALTKQYPTSLVLFMIHAASLREIHDFDRADKLAQARLQRLPDDEMAIRSLGLDAVGRDDFANARAQEQKIVDAGMPDVEDLNNIAWYALFMPKIEDSDISAAIKATQLDRNSGSTLHTLGCVYAAAGQTEKARGLLIQAMDLQNLDQPDSNFWYAFGLIAEQYGERAAAISDYSRATPPKPGFQEKASSYRLAQLRLQALGANQLSGTSPK